MNSYNREQFETLVRVKEHLEAIHFEARKQLLEKIQGYLSFRKKVDNFLNRHFNNLCTSQCYATARSACCSREGVITFFADVATNALVSDERQLGLLLASLKQDTGGGKCVYLGPAGCLWRLKPIVCEMFLCDPAREQVFLRAPHLARAWEELENHRKRYTWPDRPVLFDALEAHFLKAGIQSPLMYLHNSPGMLRLKSKWRRQHPNLKGFR